MFNKLLAVEHEFGDPSSKSSLLDAKSVGIPEVAANDDTIRNVLSYVFAFAGALSVVMIIIGGIRYILSTGNPQQTTSARNAIIYAIVGLGISLTAFVIVNFIFKAAGSSPTAGSLSNLAAFL